MSDELKLRFGYRLSGLRRDREITQAELAEACGVSEETISRIERGVFGPRFELLDKLACALGLPVAELFCFCNE